MPPAFAEPDVLVRPALPSVHASRAVILAVTRAGSRLVAVGERGIVLLSDDNGTQWRQAAVPVSVTLTGVHFPTEHQGWVVGHSGVVLRSVDGGGTWTKAMDGIRAAQLVLDAARAAARSGAPEAAQRLGQAERLVRDGPDKPFLDVYFVDVRHGFVVGAYGLFLATRDAGATWVPWDDRVRNQESKHLYALRPSGGALYLAGEQGALYRSTDGGDSFVALRPPSAATFFGVVSAARGAILLFGLRGNAFWSSDAGQTWQPARLPTTATLTAGLLLEDDSLVVVADDGGVFRAMPGDRAFRRMDPGRLFPFTGAAQAADGSLILCGARGLVRMAPREWSSQPR